ncbi:MULTISPECIES: cytosine permease [unclassified Streptomyces]|uniref:purine-cytosine permease family protein n=1 Tax=unclassified Streptomyces TaxID=2593676 RepID=UPI000823BED6|nr:MULTISPECIES: cytosine permease [unclassified Streptomyces]MYU02221.1 cytosine permease [Streptomyces sp. SID8350]SCK63104.1 nucleobase:cation symporter-1, NCS1 family [Streptomyces sp. AmelKG-D3]
MSTDSEQPVYGSSLTKVEPFGIDPIPDSERHGKPSSQFFVWFAAGLNFTIMMLGFSAASLGLNFTAATAAIAVGAALGSVLMAVGTRTGVRLGVPVQIQARGPFGFYGNFVPVACINVFAAIGWAAVTVILCGKALAVLTGLPFWLVTLVITAVQMTVVILGSNMINFLQKVLSYVLTPLFLLVTVVALVRGGDAVPDAVSTSSGTVGGFVTLAGWFMSFLVAWLPYSSDYSRYLPDTGPVRRRTAWYTGLGSFVTICWLGILGVLVGSSASSSDAIEALNQLAGPFAIPALIAISLSALSHNFLNVYGGAISVQTLKIPLSRAQAVAVICLLAYGISLWGHTGTEDKFKVFLNLTANFIAPFAIIILMDYLLSKGAVADRVTRLYDQRRVLDWGAVAWGASVLVSVPFWQSSVYTGPLAKAFPEVGDVSMLVAMAAAALLYPLAKRLPPLWLRNGGSEAPVEARERVEV